jgi:hypothetical protein
MVFPYQKVSTTLIADLHPRTRDILRRRFGLHGKESETLEAIGQDHAITRERVRQIVEDGILQVKERSSEQEMLKEIFELLSRVLKEAGHVKRQDLIVEALEAPEAANHIVFLLHLGDQFWKQKETEHVHPFWASKKEVFDGSALVLEGVLRHLRQEKQAIVFEDLIKAYSKSTGEKLTPQTFASLLEVSKYITKAYNGKWGLREWPEVYPKGMRDKAYVVLKNTGKSLHFVEVAKLIEQLQGSLESKKVKNVLPQTVHNELIKDARFVLVGRGTYALEEWGYKPGTVKDVIIQLLRESGEPLDKEEIIEKTLGQRQVKESTILLNLQDKNYFVKDEGGRYRVFT